MLSIQTSVSMSPRDALLDPLVFPNPTQFDPGRWLRPTSESHMHQMNKYYIPFNKGPRKCLGFKYVLLFAFPNRSDCGTHAPPSS